MKTVKRLLGLMLAGVLAAGTLQGTVCASQKESARTDAAAVFGNKVKELEKKYGVLKEGRETIRIDTKEYFTSMESPFEADKDGGMLFAYVHDFDFDGADELLTLRRERGTASLIQDGTPFNSDMYKYIFDMFEMKDGQCTHADSRTIGVFDVLNWSINYKCISVFLHETDRFVDICTETFISQQDHPSDTALVRIRYNGTVFSDDNGIRFGYWYSENGVRCMKPVSEAALNYLSDMFPSEETFWADLVSTDSEQDRKFTEARDQRLEALGFKLFETRQDFLDAYDPSEMNDAELSMMDAEFSAITALDCYAPVSGSMTMMAFVNEQVQREMDENGMTVIVRSVDKEKKVSDK